MVATAVDRSADYSFNVMFLRRFWRLQRVFFPAAMSVNSGLFLLLLLTSGLEQYLAYGVGIIAGEGVVDPKLFFSDPDPTFQEISDPDPISNPT